MALLTTRAPPLVSFCSFFSFSFSFFCFFFVAQQFILLVYPLISVILAVASLKWTPLSKAELILSGTNVIGQRFADETAPVSRYNENYFCTIHECRGLL